MAPHPPFWGNVTATIDWCEENYVASPYIAEFWNTVSNMLMVFLALFGFKKFVDYGVERRFAMSYLALMTVGVGSTLFHGTLLYEMQLLDELPMIYGTCVFLYVLLEDERTPKYGWKLVFFLGLYSTVVTVVYLVLKKPIFHEVAYGILVAGVVFLCARMLRRHPTPALYRLFWFAFASYGFGFFLWNIDNNFCHHLRNTRDESHPAVAPVYQLHAWWHIFTGYATYLQIIFCLYYRMHILGKRPSIRFALGVPYVQSHFERKNQ
eukprot:Opistho-2@54641